MIKGFAIIFIVIGHISNVPLFNKLFPLDLLTNYHVACFFMVSGFFIKQDELNNPKLFIKKKLKQLYLPYIYVYVAFTLLHNVFIKIGWYDIETLYGTNKVEYWTLTDMSMYIMKALLLAGREPICGAMWFITTLIFALCGFSLINTLIRRYFKHDKCVTLIVIGFFAITSCFLKQEFNFAIPRFSNVFPAMLLIFVGKETFPMIKTLGNNLSKKYKLALLMFILLSYWHLVVSTTHVSFNGNKFNDILTLCIGTGLAVVSIYLLSEFIKGSLFSKVIQYCGKESFYIMAFQFAGFKVASQIVKLSGFYDAQVSALFPSSDHNIMMFLYYVLFSILFSIAIIYIVRLFKNLIFNGKAFNNNCLS